MKFSAQEEFGLRCLLQIARLGPQGTMTIPEISRNEGVTATHAAKLLMILRKGGFIRSTRGVQGGYCLSRPATDIRVGDVLAVLGGRLYDEKFCGRHSGINEICTHNVDCSVRSIWQVVQTAVDEVLDGITVADLLRRSNSGINVQFVERREVAKV